MGAPVFTGTLPAATTVLVGALVAGLLEPPEFAAVIEIVRGFPTSADTGT